MPLLKMQYLWISSETLLICESLLFQVSPTMTAVFESSQNLYTSVKWFHVFDFEHFLNLQTPWQQQLLHKPLTPLTYILLQITHNELMSKVSVWPLLFQFRKGSFAYLKNIATLKWYILYRFIYISNTLICPLWLVLQSYMQSLSIYIYISIITLTKTTSRESLHALGGKTLNSND